MDHGFGIIVLDNEGRIIDYAMPINIPYNIMKEAIGLGYDIYRVISTVVKELGYKLPRYITIKLDDYEVSLFKRSDKLILVVLYTQKQVEIHKTVREQAVVED